MLRTSESGLYYFNARYYDPEIGQFISPDTIVPDPGKVFGYNRYMYTYGNPLNLVDPSGHETSKPNWWPKYLPYTLDLPDEWSYEGFVEWAGENNIPTAVSGQAGGSVTSGYGVHGSFSGEAQGTINWLSGEFMWSWNNSAGTRFGTPVNGGTIHAGGSIHYNASSVQQLQDSSLSVGVDGEADLGIRVGGQVAFARAVEYADANGNGSFDMLDGEGAYFRPVIDPDFMSPVDSLSANLAGGFDITPNVAEFGGTTAINDTNPVIQADLYAPFRRALDWIGGVQ